MYISNFREWECALGLDKLVILLIRIDEDYWLTFSFAIWFQKKFLKIMVKYLLFCLHVVTNWASVRQSWEGYPNTFPDNPIEFDS